MRLERPVEPGLDETTAAINGLIDAFVAAIGNRDPALVDQLWGEGGFRMIGSEVGEICRSRAELEAKIGSIFAHPARFLFDFPDRDVTFAGSVAWVFAQGTLSRIEPGGAASRPYLVTCIFERVGSVWRWRQFFGSEPS